MIDIKEILENLIMRKNMEVNAAYIQKVRKARLEKLLRKANTYKLHKGESIFIENHIAKLNKDWGESNKLYTRALCERDRLSSSICQVRDIIRGKSSKNIVDVLSKLIIVKYQ